MSHSRGRYEKTSYVFEAYNKHDKLSFLIESYIKVSNDPMIISKSFFLEESRNIHVDVSKC